MQNNSGKLLLSDDAPEARAFHSAVYCESQNIMVIFGGLGGGGYEIYGDLWIYNINDNDWYVPQVCGTPPPPRYGHSGMISIT